MIKILTLYSRFTDFKLLHLTGMCAFALLIIPCVVCGEYPVRGAPSLLTIFVLSRLAFIEIVILV